MHACGGITRVGATVARLATYTVAEDLLPEKMLISCAPAFLRGVEEDVLMVLKSPSFALDGCEWSCGTNLLYLAGITPAVRFLLPEYAEAQGYDLSGGSRRFPSGVTQAFARVVAERVAGIGAADDDSRQPLSVRPPRAEDAARQVVPHGAEHAGGHGVRRSWSPASTGRRPCRRCPRRSPALRAAVDGSSSGRCAVAASGEGTV